MGAMMVNWRHAGRLVGVIGLPLAILAGCAPKAEQKPAPPEPPKVATPEPPPPPLAPPSVPGIRLVQARAEAVAAARYRPEQGVVTRIERAMVRPGVAKPEERVTFQARYMVLAPDETAAVKVRETRTVLFGGQPLMDLPSRELTLAQGTSEVEFEIPLPSDAADGDYGLSVILEPIPAAGSPTEATTRFVVSATGLVTPPAPAPAPPVPRGPVVLKVVFVTVASMDLRGGPGPEFKPHARIFKGMRLEVLEENVAKAGRWYRVRLVTGDEGWVPAAATGASP